MDLREGPFYDGGSPLSNRTPRAVAAKAFLRKKLQRDKIDR
jgi:hypothetical protein